MTTLYPRLLAYLEVEKQERGAQKTTTPTISTSEYSWDEQLRSWSKEQACKKNDDNRSTLYKLDTSLRSLPPVSGYFWIRKFFSPDSKISTSTHSVFKLNFLVHKYADSLSFRQLVWKVKKKKNLANAKLFSPFFRKKKKTFSLTKLPHQALVCSFKFFIGGQFVRPTSKEAWECPRHRLA